MQHFAVTFFSFPDCTYETSTCFADSATPLFRARTAVELRRSRTGDDEGSGLVEVGAAVTTSPMVWPGRVSVIRLWANKRAIAAFPSGKGKKVGSFFPSS